MELLKIAASQLGITEISGSENNEQIVRYATETGISGISNDEIAWCSTFVNWCAKQVGLPMSGKPNARSWLRVGAASTQPEPGDVVVFWRESLHSWKGHVAIFLGFNEQGNKLFCLGGNQGNAVSIASYDTAKVLGYRRLTKTKKLSMPQPILKKSDKGNEVIKLQLVLNQLKYICGDADGHFGQKTHDALMLLQANNQLNLDGIYGNKTKTCMESLMQQ